MTQKEQGYEYSGTKDAEDILEKDMYRQNWQAPDRDNIAKRLEGIVREQAIAKRNGQ